MHCALIVVADWIARACEPDRLGPENSDKKNILAAKLRSLVIVNLGEPRRRSPIVFDVRHWTRMKKRSKRNFLFDVRSENVRVDLPKNLLAVSVSGVEKNGFIVARRLGEADPRRRFVVPFPAVQK